MRNLIGEKVTRRARGLISWAGSITAPYQPGHYHSPVPSRREIRQRRERLFRVPDTLPGIDVDLDAQLRLADDFAAFMPDMPFTAEHHPGLRYRLENGWFAHGDGLALYSMLRHLKPARYLEIGSGWSSALTLDVNDRFLGGATHLTFVEPNPERLDSLLTDTDRQHATVIRASLSEAGDIFDDLRAGDVLFIDSSHVSRIGSDVNQLILDVLPQLPPGVFVHVHDIFWPFEYPEDWLLKGRAWNEAYLLRAYLADNDRVKVVWFNSYLNHAAPEVIARKLPGWRVSPGGSIWLRT